MKRLLGRLAMKVRLFNKVNMTRTKVLNNRAIKVPIIREMGLGILSHTEVWMVNLLAELLPRTDGIFIDVGVNLGQSLIHLRSVNTELDYVGFEPNPVCVFYVKELIKANGFKNVRLVPVGLFDDTCLLELEFMTEHEHDMAASVVPDFRPPSDIVRREYVPLFNFETVAAKLRIDKIAVVKIDVEGAELEVLQSMAKVLREQRPVVMLEILPTYTEENTVRWERQQGIEKLMAELDYQLLRVQKTAEDQYDGLKAIDEVGIHSDLDACDYVAVPSERREKFADIIRD